MKMSAYFNVSNNMTICQYVSLARYLLFNGAN